MKFNYISKFVLAFVLIVATSVSAQIELPFDYFYGRWVDGHYYHYNFTVMDFDFDEYSWNNQYIFTKDALQIKLGRFSKYIFWNESNSKDDIIKAFSPDLDVLYRVSDHWQLGLEEIGVIEYNSYTHSHFSIVSKFAKNKNIRISEKHAPYAYINKKLISQGDYIFDNSFTYNNSYSNYYIQNNSFHYGLTNDIKIVTNMRLIFNFKNSFRPNYSFSIISGLIAPVYLDMSVSQSFDDAQLKEKRSTQFKTDFTYISNGEFNSDIIINDYNNYYRNMLFHKQFLFFVSTDYNEYRRNDDYDVEDDKSFNIKMKSVYGLTSHINIESFLTYANSSAYDIQYYRNFPYYDVRIDVIARESISYSLNIKYISYPFNQSSSTRYNNDSNYDIMFGNVLLAKQFYMELSISPPEYNNNDESKIDYFALDKLQSNNRFNINLLTSIGVGKYTEFLVQFGYRSWHNQYNHINQYQLIMGVDKRIYEKLNFSFDINKSFGDNYLFNPYWIDGSFSILL